MTVPFMRAYSQLLVQICHKRGIHAIGGMAAFIPNRKDIAINQMAFDKVRADKELEASTGFDGTWVAHPDLVAVAIEPFNKILGQKPNQKSKQLDDLKINASDLLNANIPEAKITEKGLRTNINVGILYIESWLRGVGAAAIYNLMEDAATAEISRAQVWQWLHHAAQTNEGRVIDKKWYRQLLQEETESIKNMVGEQEFESRPFKKAIVTFDRLVSQPQFEAFLTSEAYQELN